MIKIKKFLIISLSTCLLFVSGCSKPDKIVQETSMSSDSRFISTGDRYTIENQYYRVVYDSITEIVYLASPNGYGGGLSLIYGNDKLPMKIDEYYETR